MDFEGRPPIEGKENPVSILIEKLEKSDIQEDFRGEAGTERKEKLKRIARRLPEIAELLLGKFRNLAKNEGLNTDTLTLFVVGGRVRGTPIKDNTDFDLVISAENKLTPFGKEPTIAFAQRHALGRALYAEIENIFTSLGLSQDYEKGILEIKGFGERAASEVQSEEDVLKIAENKS